MQRTLTKKRLAYLMATMLFALTISATSTYAWFDFYLLSGEIATLIIVLLFLVAGAIVYAKWFRGSIDFSKLKSKLSRK